mmetsp:Transcript_40069/g.105124  ORF Transcript_40069/g.105124 Transcript_40069/m.105124 type:complete len:92 (+) Transcript_40069:215-490(+)
MTRDCATKSAPSLHDHRPDRTPPPRRAASGSGQQQAEAGYTTTADCRCFSNQATWGLSDPSALGSTLLQDDPHHGPAAHQVQPIQAGCCSM